MKQSELQKDSTLQEMFELMQFSKKTEQNYIMSMRSYTEYMQQTPGELVEDARQEIREGKMLSERSLKKHLLGFRKHLSDKELAPLTIKTHLSRIISFYKFYDIEVPKIPRAQATARTLEDNDRIPTVEEIREVLKVANPLEKALILVGCSAGLSANELRRLTIGQFKTGYDKETGITTITMRRKKSGVDFVTFFSPEASAAVWDYLKFRDRPAISKHPKVIEQQRKQRVLSDKGFLFIMEKISMEFSGPGDEHMRQMTSETIAAMYRRLSRKAGVDADGSWRLIRAHNMRKRYNSSMLNAGADSFFVEYTMGHILDATRGAYFRASPDKLKDLYIGFVPALMIQEAIDLESSEEYKRMQAENEMYAATKGRDSLKVDMALNDIEQLKIQLEAMSKAMEIYGLVAGEKK